MLNKLVTASITLLSFCFNCAEKCEDNTRMFCDDCRTPKRFDCPHCGINHQHYWSFCKGKHLMYNDVKIVSIDDL